MSITDSLQYSDRRDRDLELQAGTIGALKGSYNTRGRMARSRGS